MERAPLSFQPHELDTGYLEQYFAAEGFGPAVGEAIALPLSSSEHPSSILMLDNATEERRIRPEQRRVLRLFCSQAEAALERAWHHEQELANSRRLAVLHRTSEEIMKLAEERKDWLWHAHAQCCNCSVCARLRARCAVYAGRRRHTLAGADGQLL